MAKIILDKNLSTEKTLDVDNIYERVMEGTLNGYKTLNIAVGSTIPQIPAVNSTFSTIEVETEEGIMIPIINTYNHVKNFNAQYYSEESTYSYNLDFDFIVEE